MQPDTYAAVLTLCNITGKTKSNMASELIEAGLRNPKYKTLIEEAEEELIVKAKEDPRTQRKGTFHRQPSVAVKNEAKRVSSYTELLNPEQAEVVESFGLDTLDKEKLQKLQQLMGLLEMMK